MNETQRHAERYLAAGFLLAIVIFGSIVLFFTRTDRGREEVLAYTLSALGGRLNGTLTIERVDGSILSGARLYGLSLIDDRGEPLVVADSGYIEYEIPTFIGGDIVISRVDLFHPELTLYRLPGDTLWNYQAVFADTIPDDTAGTPRVTLIKRLDLHDAHVEVRGPWEPDERLSPAERQRELEDALSPDGRLMVERAEGGFLRTMLFSLSEARLSTLIIAPDERGGTFVQVDSAAGDVRLWRDPPLRLADAAARVSLLDGVLSVQLARAVSGNSAVRGGGTIDMRDDEMRYDMAFVGNEIALADLQWLLPTVPDDGTVSGEFRFETRPEGFYLAARNASLATPDTRVTGNFGVVMGDTLRFTDVDLRASPLHVATVQRLLPGATPIEGLRIGSAVIESPGAS